MLLRSVTVSRSVLLLGFSVRIGRSAYRLVRRVDSVRRPDCGNAVGSWTAGVPESHYRCQFARELPSTIGAHEDPHCGLCSGVAARIGRLSTAWRLWDWGGRRWVGGQSSDGGAQLMGVGYGLPSEVFGDDGAAAVTALSSDRSTRLCTWHRGRGRGTLTAGGDRRRP